MQLDGLGVERKLDFADRAECGRLVVFGHPEVRRLQRKIIEAENDVLTRHNDWLAVRRAQDVVRGHHEHARFELRLEAQRHVHGHLVAVEIRVERGANQRMQLDRLAFDQHRLKRLNAKPVQRRCTVQHHRVLAYHLFENIPNFRPLFLHHCASPP